MGKQKVIRTGNSLAVTIPSDFVKMIGIKSGQEIKVIVKPDKGRLICCFSGSKQLPLSCFTQVPERKNKRKA